MEEWRDISDFPGYQVSNLGNVRSFYKPNGYGGGAKIDMHRSPKMLHSTRVGTGGHRRIFLYKDGQRIPLLLHRVVAEAFIPNPKSYPIVRHRNDDPNDNRAENLIWGTQKDNVHDCINHHGMDYSGMRTYNEKRKTPIKAISVETGVASFFDSQNEASRTLGISQGNIWTSMKNNRSTCGYIFKRVKEGE